MSWKTSKHNRQMLAHQVADCIKFGKFKLRSGEESFYKCDLVEARVWFPWMIRMLEPQYPPVGLVTGGALLVASLVEYGLVCKDQEGRYAEVYLPQSHGGIVSLVDDVVTTGQSFGEVTRLLASMGVKVGEWLAVFDRSGKDLGVRSLFTPQDLVKLTDRFVDGWAE